MPDQENRNTSLFDEDSDEVQEPEKCFCGYTRDHHMVSPIATYTAWGKFWIILMGVSSIPIRIDFQCRICKERFDFTVDGEELKKYL